MTLEHLLNVEWFGYLIFAFLILSIIKSAYQILVYILNEIGEKG